MKLYIEKDFATQRVKFWIVSYEGHPKKYLGHNKGKLTEYTVEFPVFKAEMKPFLELDYVLANDFIKLIADHANSNGIKTEQRSFIEGELLATKKHLDTMEKINFILLNQPPIT